MKYMTAAEAAALWGVSLRQVQRLLAQGRIQDARKYQRSWQIPSDAFKPGNLRSAQPESPYIKRLMLIDGVPIPSEHPESLLALGHSEAERVQIAGELGYLRGDFKAALIPYQSTDKSSPTRLCALYIASLAAVSDGQLDLYARIEQEQRLLLEAWADDAKTAELLKLSLYIIRTSTYTPDKPFDLLAFRHLPEETRRTMLYCYAKQLHSLGQLGRMMGVVEVALSELNDAEMCSADVIYLLLMGAAACVHMHDELGAKQYEERAIAACMPGGLITPLAEASIALGGTLELALERANPDFAARVAARSEQTLRRWTHMHLRYVRDHVTDLLSVPEYQTAMLASRDYTNRQIARRLCCSQATVKKRLENAYQKLNIHRRSELKHYIIWTDELKK